MFVVAPEHDGLLIKVIGAAMLLLSLWCLEKALRLVVGIRREHGLLSLFALRVVAVAFLLMPVNGSVPQPDAGQLVSRGQPN